MEKAASAEPSSEDTDMDVDDTHIFAPDGVPQPGVAEDMPSDEPAIEAHYDDVQPDDDHREQQDVDDALQPSVLVADAASAPVETPVDEAVDPSIISLKIEEIEGAHALHESPGVISNDAMDVDQDSDRLRGTVEPTKVEGVDNIRSSDALKETSNNPLLIAQSDADPSSQKADAASGPSSLQSERAKALRSSIASLPDNALFVQFDALALSTPDSNGTGGSTSQAVQDTTDVDLPALFPGVADLWFH